MLKVKVKYPQRSRSNIPKTINIWSLFRCYLIHRLITLYTNLHLIILITEVTVSKDQGHKLRSNVPKTENLPYRSNYQPKIMGKGNSLECLNLLNDKILDAISPKAFISGFNVQHHKRLLMTRLNEIERLNNEVQVPCLRGLRNDRQKLYFLLPPTVPPQ